MKAIRDRAPFEIGGSVVAAGARAIVRLPLATLSTQAPVEMPVHVVHGRHSGPRLLVCAAIHGDEINGIEIIRRVLQLRSLGRLHGTLIAVPVVNVVGFIAQSRYLPDRRDLNRSFPGRGTGSLAARLAQMFFTAIVSRCTHGVDLHTAAIHRDNYPQIRADLDHPANMQMAEAFGVPVAIHASSREGSLREAAAEIDVPFIVYEGGEALRFSEPAIRAGVRGVVGVMRALGMLPARTRPVSAPRMHVARSTAWVRAPLSGVFRATSPLGSAVTEGEVLGRLADPLGVDTCEVVASTGGIIIGRTHLPVVYEGDALFHIARFAGTGSVTRTIDEFSPESAYEDVARDLPNEAPIIK